MRPVFAPHAGNGAGGAGGAQHVWGCEVVGVAHGGSGTDGAEGAARVDGADGAGRGRVRLWTRRFTVLVLATLGVCLVTNIYNLGMTYYADLLQGDIAYAGVSAGVFSLASLVAKPLAGGLSNRFDRVRLALGASFFIAAVSLAHGLVSTIGELAVVRALHGAAFALFATAAGAEVNATLPRERLSEGLGFYSVASALAPAIGPTMFLAMVEEGDLASFGGVFALSAGISVVAAALLLFGLRARSAAPSASEGAKHPPEGAGRVRGAGGAGRGKGGGWPLPACSRETPGMLLPAALLCLCAFAYAPVNFFLPEYAFHADLGNVGPFYLVFAACSVASRFLVGKRADAKGPQRYVTAGMVLVALSYAAIPLCPSVAALTVLAAPLGVGMGVVSPLLNVYIVRFCPPGRPGSASAAYYAAYDVGYVAGSFLTGLVIASWGYTVLFWGAACVVACALVAFLARLARVG